MPNIDRKYDNMLFHKPTTYTECYQIREPTSLAPIRYGTIHKKQKKPRPEYVPIKDLHALTPWRDPNIPFNAFHRPDPITKRNPWKMQERYDKLQDADRAKIQKSRPKVLMKGPATDLDAYKEPDRKLIIDSIYTTTTSIAQRTAVEGVNFKNVKAPLPNSYSKCRPVYIEPLIKRYVSPEWRMETVTWDDKQLRAFVYPTKHFWLNRKKP